MSNLSRRKGMRVEREIVSLHKKIGVKAERVPLSGAARYQGNGQDVDVYIANDTTPLYCQVKALADTAGTKLLLGWLADADCLFLRYDAEPGHPARPPLVIVPWSTWERLLRRS